MKKSVIYGIIATLSMLIIFMLFIAFVNVSAKFDELDEATIISPDLSIVDDGIYLGSYEVFPLSVTVSITIENHLYQSIEITDHSLIFDMQAEQIIATIINSQTLEITLTDEFIYSEKVLLKAIMNAFEVV